jgi:hypothetical protein
MYEQRDESVLSIKKIREWAVEVGHKQRYESEKNSAWDIKKYCQIYDVCRLVKNKQTDRVVQY